MSDIQALLQPLKDRLAAATPGPWKAEPYLSGVVEDGRVRVTSPSNSGIYNTAEDVLPNDAALIAAAPTDQAKLIVAIEQVAALADYFDDLASLTSYNQPSAVTEAHLEAATMIRAALTQALGGDTA